MSKLIITILHDILDELVPSETVFLQAVFQAPEMEKIEIKTYFFTHLRNQDLVAVLLFEMFSFQLVVMRKSTESNCIAAF